MYEFIKYVLWELQNSLGLVLLVGIGTGLVLAAAWFVHRRKYKGEKNFPWGRAALYLLLTGYLAIVLYATILRGTGGWRQVNWHFGRAWREAWNNFTAKNWANVLLNVAMFVPLGFLLPLLWRRFRKWYLALSASFGVSLAIELIQLALGRGICDVDDLFANTLGAFLGYLIIMAALSLKGRRWKSGLVYGALGLGAVLAIGSIFLVYELREYGNLPLAAAYTVDTGDVEWSLNCRLPELGETAAVYRTQTRSLEECDAFAEEFRQIIPTEYNTVSYYQEAAYYMDNGSEGGAHFLFVNYLDTGYSYTAIFDDEAAWADADRQTIEGALAKYPVMIPEAAEFVAEGEGWYSFQAEQIMDGAVMMDGTLRCRYAQDGTIREIENGLLAYTYYSTVEVISPEEAYGQLRSGKFYDDGYFGYYDPETAAVVSCALGYAVDTKGFYQPVYYFEVAFGAGGDVCRILIPAMK